jgi:hypothetical protein
VTPERLEEIKKWRKRVKVDDLTDTPGITLTYILDGWLTVVDELIEALEGK